MKERGAYIDLELTAQELRPIITYCEYIKKRDGNQYTTSKALMELCRTYKQVVDVVLKQNGSTLIDLITFEVLLDVIQNRRTPEDIAWAIGIVQNGSK